MVQVLPYVPTFGEKLAPVLSEAAGKVGEGFQRQRAQAAWQRLITPQQPQMPSGVGQMQQIAQQQGNQMPQSPMQMALSKPGGPSLGEIQSLVNTAEAANPGSGKMVFDYVQNQQKLAQKEKVQEHKEETEAYKITKDYRDKILDAYEGYNRTNMQLDRMKQLNKEDKLTTPLMAKVSESLGIPLSVLANPESEEYQKLSQDLMSNITKYFGNRILQVEVENFLKTIPTLMNSKEGRAKIIDNMQLLMEPQKMAYDAYKDIRKQGGKIPLDLHERVLEKMEPRLNKLAEKFRESSDTLSAMPAPQQYKGQRIENTETGEIFMSDGNEWKPVGGRK